MGLALAGHHWLRGPCAKNRNVVPAVPAVAGPAAPPEVPGLGITSPNTVLLLGPGLPVHSQLGAAAVGSTSG